MNFEKALKRHGCKIFLLVFSLRRPSGLSGMDFGFGANLTMLAENAYLRELITEIPVCEIFYGIERTKNGMSNRYEFSEDVA